MSYVMRKSAFPAILEYDLLGYKKLHVPIVLWFMIKQIWAASLTKPTKWHVRPAKTQISLGIHPVWSESLLSAWRNILSSVTHWVHWEDWSDWVDAQASLRWAHRSFCWCCHEAAQLQKLYFVGNKQQRHWSDYTNVQADLCLCCLHIA